MKINARLTDEEAINICDFLIGLEKMTENHIKWGIFDNQLIFMIDDYYLDYLLSFSPLTESVGFKKLDIVLDFINILKAKQESTF